MPKRTLISSPSTTNTKSKKVKVTKGQSSLDAFFTGSPQKADDVTTELKGKGKAKEYIDDSDYAAALATQEGLDLATVRRLESEWKESRKQLEVQEVIDVDHVVEKGRTDCVLNITKEPGPFDRTAQVSRGRSMDAITAAKQANFANPSMSPPVYRSLSVDPLAFALDDEPWLHGASAPYSFLSHTLATLSETRSRILIINTLTNSLRTLSRYDPASLLPALYLLSNSLSPPYLSIELGLGPSIISKAIQQVSGLTPAALKRLYNATGDVGDVAFEAKSNIRTLIPHPPLLITSVYNALLKIANSKGLGAAKHKQGIVEKLLVSAKGEETRFLTRTLSMNLRVGAVRTSILTALARAIVLTPPVALSVPIPNDSPYRMDLIYAPNVDDVSTSPKKKSGGAEDPARFEANDKFSRAESLLKKVFVQHPNYDHIVTALLEAGLDGLADRVPLAVGIPLHPTLGSPTRSLDEIYDRLGDLSFAAEYKYDGQRAQIHCKRNNSGNVDVHVFSRHLEDMTTKYPDVISLMQEIFTDKPELQSFIIDSEIVAIDPIDGTLKTFQELSNRARKDVEIHDVKVAVGIYAFDLMYMDEKILLEEPFRKRRALLKERLPPFIPAQKGAARFDHVESYESEDGREGLEEFWMTAVDSRCEGLMIKLLDSGEVLEEHTPKKDKVRRKPLPATYEPDKRTSAWLKLKKDYVTGLGDSLDLIPIGAWHGNGRKSQWWSPILLALRDGNSGRLVAVCKCMSGFTDVFYKAMKNRYSEGSATCSTQNLWDVDTGGLRPKVYFKPDEVWEIRGADVTLSPVSVAAMGLVSDKRGLSLRFPRFIKLREDKKLEQASTPEFLAKMWKDQQGKQVGDKGADEGDLVDVDSENFVDEEDSDS